MARKATASKPEYRTIEARPNGETLIKPGELVDLVEVTPLTLVDRRIYNQLLEHAWDAIDKPVTHVIAKSALRGSHNSNDRIGESLERLMAAIVRVAVKREGEPAIERVQLLGGNVETVRRDGLLEYEIPPGLRRIIKNSTIFARLQREVMFALTSKYALTLYEMVQKRGNLRWRDSERFALSELRGILGVPKGKLTTWSNLRLRAIDPAVKEVNRLSDYVVELTPIKTGRSVSHVELRWWKKDSEGQGAVARELRFSKVGRKERGSGRVDTVVAPTRARDAGQGVKPRPAWLDRHGSSLALATYETARMRHSGYDVYAVEAEWRRWARGKTPANDPDRAFLAFFRKFAEAHPL
jgi:Initiator Rep protein, WH2/Initiator Replication protein, WH1